MGRMNAGRVVLGGLLAGLVINIGETILNLVLVPREMDAALSARNLPPVGGGAIGAFVASAIVLGIATVWLYAAIRPRFGAGPKTAFIGGLAIWYFAYFYGATARVLMGLFPLRVTAVGAAWGLAEIVLASLAGAAVYRE